MKIALLGYGKEGKSAENYIKTHFNSPEIDIFENFTPEEIREKDYSSYDMIFRSPSVPPLGLENETSVTKYFFDHCPCKIIGVTATKGKGTTCSFIKSLLDAHGEKAHLVGNIGSPSIDILDELDEKSVVVYELSSFQLWDLKKSPKIAVIGQLEPDHLNVHKDYEDYLGAKANITKYQTEEDFLIYYKNNPETARIAEFSKAKKIPYPFEISPEIKSAIKIPGKHNEENALAAIAAVASYKNISPDEYLRDYKTEIIKGLESFKGLPHRLEFIRELNNVKYYDDNFSTNPSSTRVAVNAFPDSNLVVIIGGRDKTNNEDLPEIYDILKAPQIKTIVLMGESGHELAKRYTDERFTVVESLKEAVETAKKKAEESAYDFAEKEAIILMSPSAASFDMFENVYDRGDQFKNLISSLN
ncbi:UDP-N-acetylmuramoyl-L-alanine--D-glutamate ligase [Candidatus Saccharibacteria bacterium]|nr:UDP-N-acetylmuramoyl-L-alanine--D-glutamate ligase [Candidatus Saccharibacteria bacterium]